MCVIKRYCLRRIRFFIFSGDRRDDDSCLSSHRHVTRIFARVIAEEELSVSYGSVKIAFFRSKTLAAGFYVRLNAK